MFYSCLAARPPRSVPSALSLCLTGWVANEQADHLSIKARVVGSLALLLGAKAVTIQVNDNGADVLTLANFP